MIFTLPQVIKLAPKPCGVRTLLPAGRCRDAPALRCRLFAQAGVPLFWHLLGYARLYTIYMTFMCRIRAMADPNTQNRRAHAQRRAGPCGAPFCARKNRFCSPKYHFRHLKLILDHTSHFRLLFHDGGRFPDDCSTEAGSQRLKSVWGLRNSLPRS